MAKDKNPFGGGNPRGLYVPITEDEQETIQRLVESQTLEIIVHPWGIISRPSKVVVGDKRVAINFGLLFTSPAEPLAIHTLDLELQALGGVTLFRKPYPTLMPDGSPLIIQAGLSIELQWDIAIDHIDSNLVKAVKPGALGLTSRRVDRDTGVRTLEGNMKLKEDRRKLLRLVETGEQKVRNEDAEALARIKDQ